MKKLHISDDLSLPPDTVTSTLVVYGGKGMGKTNLGSVLVEELTKAGLRWCALDPLGVWWGLRHSKDGKEPGIECVILGGAHGDIPIEPTGGAVAADLVVDEPANVIIDFSRKPSGDMWGIGEKIRFVTEYCHRLFQRQGGLLDGRRREPIFQILDEAARYIPQQIRSGDADIAKCVGAWETLVEEGRNVGIGVGLLTQRSARMNKSVSEVADAMISFRIVGPNSIDAVMEWMGEHVAKEKIKGHIETLRKLPRGECLVVSPGWLQFEDIVLIRERETFDSSATPKPGERPKRVTGEAAKPDLAKYAERMRETIERVKADDPKELRRTIAELKKQVASQKPIAASVGKIDPEKLKAQIERAVASALKQRNVAWMRCMRDYQREMEKRTLEQLRALSGVINSVPFAVPNDADIQPTIIEERPLPVRPAPMPRPISPRPAKAAESNGALSAAQVKVLSRLVELMECTGQSQVRREQLAAWSVYSPTSSGFNNYLGALRSAGLIEYPSGGYVSITEEGKKHAQPEEVPVSSDQMLDRAKAVLGGGEAKLLEILHASRTAIAKPDLADAAGYSPTSSGFNNYLGHMRTLGFIEYPSPGAVRCSDWLYLGEAA
jgi:uncharacterized protein